MREILFRGKDIKGNWYEGLLAHNIAKDEWYISNKAGISTAYQVRPETIGQYTGLTDKNGTKIFEGDIVSLGGANYPVIFNTLGGCAEFALTDGVPFGFDYIHVPMEVVGNIYDNPELIGGNNND